MRKKRLLAILAIGERSRGYAINGTRQTTIAYDTYGRIATMCMAEGRSGVLTASNENEFVWSYLPNTDLKASLLYPNGLTASWTYDANNQLLQVCNAMPTNVISQFDYTYDAAGRRIAIAKSGSAFGDLSGSVDTYTYNARSELTSARRTKNGQPIPGFSEDFDYDPIGNRRTSATYNEKGEAQTSTYQANNLNQYTSRTTPGYAAVRGEADPNATVTVNENPAFRLGSYYFGSDLFDNSSSGGLANLETYATLAQTAANGEETEDLVSATTNQVYIAQSHETFAYDDDGNQTLITTKTGLWRVTYNGENRPIRWERDSDGTTLVMSYDHMGRRREKNNQRFFYDSYLQVADNAGNSYIWDCTETIATRPLAWLRADSSEFYAHDGNKNVSDVIAADGSMAAHYEYAPFGAVFVQCSLSASANPWHFSSEYTDKELGSDYFNYRHSFQEMGRWMSRDSFPNLSPYLYCLNQPILMTDFLGETNNPGDFGWGNYNAPTSRPQIGPMVRCCCKQSCKMVDCQEHFSWKGTLTAASIGKGFGGTYLALDIESNFNCLYCAKFSIRIEALLANVSIGPLPYSITGSEVEFGNYSPSQFSGDIYYFSAGIGAMAVLEASYIRFGEAKAGGIGLSGGCEIGVGVSKFAHIIKFDVSEHSCDEVR